MSARLISALITVSLVLLVAAACGDAEEKLDQPTPTPSAASAAPSSSRDTPAGWMVYKDDVNDFSFAHPPDLIRSEQTVRLTEVNGIPATDLRIISFDRVDGAPVAAVSVTPNPAGVSLEEWIRKQPGWPCEPSAVPTCEPMQLNISGEPAIRFSLDTLGQPTATVYVAHGSDIYVLYGNVFGSKGGASATLSEAEFQDFLDSFKFDAE